MTELFQTILFTSLLVIWSDGYEERRYYYEIDGCPSVQEFIRYVRRHSPGSKVIAWPECKDLNQKILAIVEESRMDGQS